MIFTNFLNSWLNKRIPIARQVTLDYKKIFVFPTKYGFLYSLMLALMLIGSINYAKSLGYALTFWLASIILLGIIHTYKNLLGLTIQPGKQMAVFADQEITLNLNIIKHFENNRHDSIIFKYGQSARQLSLINQTSQQIQLRLPAQKRGRFQPERILIETYYPLGLIRAWSWIKLDIQILIYPAPLKNDVLKYEIVQQNNETSRGQLMTKGGDEYYGIRDYQNGDNLRHVAWKNYAKSQKLSTKLFVNHASPSRDIHWQKFHDNNIESLLSKMTYWVIELSKQGKEFSLTLPDNSHLKQGSGTSHETSCLEALANY